MLVVDQIQPDFQKVHPTDAVFFALVVLCDFNPFFLNADDSFSLFTLLGKCEGKGSSIDKMDMSAYTKYTFSMFGGETVPVTMVFQNRMMGAVMDRFGRDVVAMKEDERHFRVTVSVAVSNQFYGWVFGLGKAVRIVGPESVKEGMKKALADIAARYED